MAESAATDPILAPLSSSGTQNAGSESSDEPLYAGFTRFELELEFVQSLANPYYLNHLAAQKFLQDPSFVEYLKYLLYFTQSEYTRYLSYPGPTLKALELLQQAKFRQDILSPDMVAHLAEQTLLLSIAPR